MPLNCPLCQDLIVGVDEDRRAYVECPSCGLGFDHNPRKARAVAAAVEVVAAPPGPLDRWLAGEPVKPRPLTVRQHIDRWRRRRPIVSTVVFGAGFLLGVAGVSLAGALTYTSVQLARVSAMHDRLATTHERVAERANRLDDQLVETAAAARRERELRRAVEQERLADRDRLSSTDQRLHALERRVRAAVAERLATEAAAEPDSNADRRLLVACEAVCLSAAAGERPSPMAEQVLRDGLASAGHGRLRGHSGAVHAIAFTPDGRWLASAGEDKTARLWPTSGNGGSAAAVLTGHSDQVWALAASADGRWLATGGHDGAVRLWDAANTSASAAPVLLRGHEGRIRVVAFSPDNRWLATCGGGFAAGSNNVRLWNLEAADIATTSEALAGHAKPVLAATFSPDGRWLATAGEDGVVMVSDLAAPSNTRRSQALDGHEGWIRALAFTPRSELLASASHDGTLRLWTINDAGAERRPTHALSGHRGWIKALAASHDGQRLLTGGSDGTARLWTTGALERGGDPVVLSGHQRAVQAVAFSPDGALAATASEDGTVRLWDLAAEEINEAAITLVCEGPMRSVQFSPDGRRLAAAGDCDTVHIWRIPAEDLVAEARMAAGRELTAEERSLYRIDPNLGPFRR